MGIESREVAEEATGRQFFAVLPPGKPIVKAVWTESRELAQDMLDNYRGEGPAELWCATRMSGPE